MDEFIRQLPHDNIKVENLWGHEFSDRLKSFRANDQVDSKLKTLDALTDYILADTEVFLNVKTVMIQTVMQHCVDDPSPPLDEWIRIFCRALELSNTNNLLCFNLIKMIFSHYRLGEKLSAAPSIEAICSILKHLQMHELLDEHVDAAVKSGWSQFITRGIFTPLSSDANKLNNEHVMIAMRNSFQEFYRWMARMAHQSTIWSDASHIFEGTLSTMFNSYVNVEDVQSYLTACLEPSISDSYTKTIATSFQTQSDLFKTYSSDIFTIVEKLVAQDRLKVAEYFIKNVILHHFKLITNLEEFIRMSIQCCQTIKTESRVLLCQILLSPATLELERKKPDKKSAKTYIDFILALLNLQMIETPKFACRLLNINDLYPWKQLNPQISHIIQSCISYESLVDESRVSELDPLTRILSIFYERAQVYSNILSATHGRCLEAIAKWSSVINDETGQTYGTHVFQMGYTMMSLVDPKQVSSDVCTKLLQMLRRQIEEGDSTLSANPGYRNFIIYLGKLIAETIENLKDPPLTLHEQVASFCLAAFDCPFKSENGSVTMSNMTSFFLWQKISNCLSSEDQVRVYQSCATRLHKLIYEEGENWLHSWWNSFWVLTGMKYPNVALDHIPEFLEEIIDHKATSMLSLLITLFAKQPEPYRCRLDDLICGLFYNDGQYLSSLSPLFQVIVHAYPEWITSNQVDYLFHSMKTCTRAENYVISIWENLSYVANVQPYLFDKHKEELVQMFINKPDPFVFRCLQQYILGSSIVRGESVAEEYLSLLIDLVKNVKDTSGAIQSQIFYTCHLIGAKYKQALENKRDDLLEFQSHPNCQTLISFIDGSKLTEENKAAFNHVINEMTQIEQRVVHTEHNLHHVTKIVERQELKVVNIDAHVNDLDRHITNIAEQVSFQARDIERIDKKTLSYIPSVWGRDVCTLLNVRANNDWRLLGKRFGYSVSELKHWAMQFDPAMSLLNEWFMTHKSDEATYGLLKTLNEIGRHDVEQIIHQAITSAGELIPDDFSMEVKRLPSVFISYQWGSQKAVLRLKENLEQAGYLCWMDTGQLGGGDKLFAKIDAGIRGAKVIVCCINKAYAQSDNCSREVHLAISTGKPMIPLQMEKQTWPPEGALGPIMSEYLYIRLFDRKANDENYWPTDKFTELLGQIRYHVAPDPDMITSQYHNWFVPRVDNLIFLQPQTNHINSSVTSFQNNVPLVITHPQIMISYQWDNQKDIVCLYDKCTQLGYRCWLDIFQMGGGDSLFEKIDKGIRNAKCILACVTPKYTKSINCRREMALADALKKPIIPLLLDETSTWPPDGPMAMVFAERTYIDFRRVVDNDNRWTGKEFESVLVLLKKLIPEVQTERPQRHLLDMQRPNTAIPTKEKKTKRVRSAPVIPQSHVCSLM